MYSYFFRDMSPARTSDKAKKPLKLPVKKEQKSSKRLKSGSPSSTLNTREENLTVSSESWNGLKIVKVNGFNSFTLIPFALLKQNLEIKKFKNTINIYNILHSQISVEHCKS